MPLTLRNALLHRVEHSRDWRAVHALSVWSAAYGAEWARLRGADAGHDAAVVVVRCARVADEAVESVRVCTCVCGRISHVPLDRLAKHRVADSGGCRKCVARKGSGLDPVVSAERAASTAAKLDVTASRAVARVTTERRISGAEQNLRDLEERSPAEAHAARAAIERLHRELRESGRVAQAAWVHAVMRLADYAREGGR